MRSHVSRKKAILSAAVISTIGSVQVFAQTNPLYWSGNNSGTTTTAKNFWLDTTTNTSVTNGTNTTTIFGSSTTDWATAPGGSTHVVWDNTKNYDAVFPTLNTTGNVTVSGNITVNSIGFTNTNTGTVYTFVPDPINGATINLTSGQIFPSTSQASGAGPSIGVAINSNGLSIVNNSNTAPSFLQLNGPNTTNYNGGDFVLGGTGNPTNDNALNDVLILSTTGLRGGGINTIKFARNFSALGSASGNFSFTSVNNNIILNSNNQSGYFRSYIGSNVSDITTYSGVISGNSDLFISSTNGQSRGGTVFNNNMTYTGNTVLLLNNSGNGSNNTGGFLQIQLDNGLPPTTGLIFGTTTLYPGSASNRTPSGAFDMHGYNQTIAALTMPVLPSTVSYSLAAGVININSGDNPGNTSVLTVDSTGTTWDGVTTTFTGSIGVPPANFVAFATATGTGAAGYAANLCNNNIALVKNGTGTLVLSPGTGLTSGTDSAGTLVTNQYTGGTTVNAGTLEIQGNGNSGSGGIVVNSGGTLKLSRNNATGNTVATSVTVNGGGSLITPSGTSSGNSYGIGGNLTIAGGLVAPGGAQAIGSATMRVAGNMTVNDQSSLNFGLVSATNYANISSTGVLTLDDGIHTINVAANLSTGTTVVPGTYYLMKFASMAFDPSDPNPLFTLGTTPGTYQYSLSYPGNTAVALTLTPTASSYVWTTDSTAQTIVDGAGTWTDQSTKFYDLSNPQSPAATWDNTKNIDVAFGNGATANGGTITLGSNIRTGGHLVFNPVATPYTVGNPGDTTTLTTVGANDGIAITNAAVGTVINSNMILEQSQTWQGTLGSTLTVNGSVTGGANASTSLVWVGSQSSALTFNGAISDGVGGPTSVTKNGVSTMTLTTANSFTGGLNIFGGTVVVSAAGAAGAGPIALNDTGNGATLNITTIGRTLSNPISVGASAGTVTVSNGAGSTFAGNMTGSGTLTLNVASGGNSTVTGNINMLGNFVKSGSGVLTVNNPVTAAAVTASGGTLGLAAPNPGIAALTLNGSNVVYGDDTYLGTESTINWTATSTLSPQTAQMSSKNWNITGGNPHINNSSTLTYTGTITGTGNINKDGTGNLIWSPTDVSGWHPGVLQINGTSTVEITSATGLNPTFTALVGNAPDAVFQIDADMTALQMRGNALMHKTGNTTLTLSGSGTTANAGGSVSIDAGRIVMMDRDSLGSVNDTAGSATAATVSKAQMSIIINPGTELVTDWVTAAGGTNGNDRFGGSISMAAGTLTRPNTQPTPTGIDVIFDTYNNGTAAGTTFDYGGSLNIMANATPSLIHNEQVNTTATTAQNIIFTMPVHVNTGSTLILQNDNNAGNDQNDFVGFRGAGDTKANFPDQGFYINSGATVQTTGPGQVRWGRTSSTGDPIIGRGAPGADAVLQIGVNASLANVYMVDAKTTAGNGASNLSALVVQGSGNAGLRIEAPMNANYIDPVGASGPNGTAGFFGLNTFTTGTFSASSVANPFTILSPNRLNALSNPFGSGNTAPSGQLTIAATDAAGATGLLNNGPNAACNVTIGFDNASGSGNLVYQIDANANGGKVSNFAGISIQRTYQTGSVTVQLVNNTAPGTASSLHDLSIDHAHGATFDIANQSMILTYTPGNSPAASIRQAIAHAYNGGAWNQPGLTSSAAAADTNGNTAVGYAEASDLGLDNGHGTWYGKQIPGEGLLVKYTYYGDENLDGVVNLDDFSIFIDGFNKLGSGWIYGDFNYDGSTDQSDFALFVKGYNASQGNPPLSQLILSDSELSASQKSALLSVVPEPTSLGIFAISAGAMAMRRRRKA